MIRLRIFCAIITLCILLLVGSLLAPTRARANGYNAVRVEARFTDVFGAVFYQALSQRRNGYKRNE